MKVEIVLCDHCNSIMTDFPRQEAYGYFMAGKIELHKNLRTDCGSSSKVGYGRGQQFCSQQCLAAELNRMLTDAHVKLKVVPVLAEVA